MRRFLFRFIGGSANQACDLLAGKVADAAVVLPDPRTGAPENLCDLGGTEKHFAGIEFSSAGADGDKGVTIQGFFTGHCGLLLS